LDLAGIQNEIVAYSVLRSIATDPRRKREQVFSACCWRDYGRSSPAGGQWCPDSPFEIGAPHFTFDPLVATYIQYCI